MALNDLQKDLYAPKDRPREHEHTVYDRETTSEQEKESRTLGSESPWAQLQKPGLERQWRTPLLRIVIGFCIFILLAFSLWTYLWIRSGMFAAHRVDLTVRGPEIVTGGQTVTYTIAYKNRNIVPLENAYIVIEHAPQINIVGPEKNIRNEGDQRTVIMLGTIPARSERSIDLSAQIVGSQRAALFIHPHLFFTASTISKEVSRDMRLGVTLDHPSIGLTVSAQQTTVSGQVVSYTVTYENTSGEEQKDVVITGKFPEGFVFADSVPQPDPEMQQRWTIGTIPNDTTGTIVVNGVLSGIRDDVKTTVFTAQRGTDAQSPVVLSRAEWVARIAQPQLTITQNLDNPEQKTATAGEQLRYALTYRNESDLGMRDVVIRVTFADRIVDFAQLQLMQGGSMDPHTRSIVWRAADIPALALLSPGQSGTIRFTVPVRADIPVRSEGDQNLAVVTVAHIDSPDVPTPIGQNKNVYSNRMALKLVSPIAFRVHAFYNDQHIKNTGPLPPRLGKTTSYTVHWSVRNGTNALTNGRVEAFLPSTITWKGATYPETETITFNPRTHKVVWEVGDIAPGTGYRSPQREVLFQVAVTPTVDQVQYAAPLVNEMTFTAQDTFAGVRVTDTAQPKTTSIPEDPSRDFGVVVR